MAACNYWNARFNAPTGMYQCPWCERDLKPKLSNSAKNPGKTFVSCSKDFGGCGLFSFLDAEPNEKFNPNNKRARTDNDAGPAYGGTNVLGPIAHAPDVANERLAELATSVANLEAKLDKCLEYIALTTDN